MILRPLKVLLMAGAGWTALAAAPAHSATCDEQFGQVREELARAEVSTSERRDYQVLLEAAQAMQQNGDQQVCLDLLKHTRGLLSERASAQPATGAAAGQASAADHAALEPMSQIARFEDIRDLDVVNSKGEKLGKIVDLVLDFNDQEVQYALLSTSGGFLGGDKLYPVPIGVFRIGDDPDRMRDAGASGEAREPGMTPASGRADLSPAAGGDWQPTVTTATAPAAASAPLAGADRPEGASGLGAIAQMTVGELVGSEVKNNRAQSVGEIDAVILPPGAVQVEAVLSVGGFLGLGDKHVAIPLSRLTPSDDGLRFKTAVTEDELKTLPEVKVDDQDRLPDDTVIAELVPAPATAAAQPGGNAHLATEARSPGAQAKATTVEQGTQTSDATDDAGEPKDPLAAKVLVLDIDRATLERAPGFSEDAYPDLADADWHRTVLAFYEDVLHIEGGSSKPKSD